MKKIAFYILIISYISCSKIKWESAPYTPLIIEADSISFAAIGDYGKAGPIAYQVSELVKGWSPDFIITLGDNNYEHGELSTIQSNISQYYCDYIYNWDAPDQYKCYGNATIEQQNRFFPSLGNHDQNSSKKAMPYLSFFTLPGKETYYEFVWGPVHFFTINSGKNGEADCCDSEQAVWLKERLTASEAPFKVVYFHHPPYSSSYHGSDESMQWPFYDWGATLVISGHSHMYERINEKSQPDLYYLVNGLSGKPSLYDCNEKPLDENRFDHFCYNGNHGALKISATNQLMNISFITIDSLHSPIDELTILR